MKIVVDYLGFSCNAIANAGAIAQLGERLPCTQEVCGSIPHSSTSIALCGVYVIHSSAGVIAGHAVTRNMFREARTP